MAASAPGSPLYLLLLLHVKIHFYLFRSKSLLLTHREVPILLALGEFTVLIISTHPSTPNTGMMFPEMPSLSATSPSVSECIHWNICTVLQIFSGSLLNQVHEVVLGANELT